MNTVGDVADVHYEVPYSAGGWIRIKEPFDIDYYVASVQRSVIR